MKKGFPGGGKFVKEADKDILEDLKKEAFFTKPAPLNTIILSAGAVQPPCFISPAFPGSLK